MYYMSKLPVVKPRMVISALKKFGFVEFRQKGSHKIFVKGDLQVVVPQHNRDMKKGTLRRIIKDLGLSVEEFKSLLR